MNKRTGPVEEMRHPSSPPGSRSINLTPEPWASFRDRGIRWRRGRRRWIWVVAFSAATRFGARRSGDGRENLDEPNAQSHTLAQKNAQHTYIHYGRRLSPATRRPETDRRLDPRGDENSKTQPAPHRPLATEPSVLLG